MKLEMKSNMLFALSLMLLFVHLSSWAFKKDDLIEINETIQKFDFYPLLLEALSEAHKAANCDACSGDFNLSEVKIYESNKLYLFSINSINNGFFIETKNVYDKFSGDKYNFKAGEFDNLDDFILIESIGGARATSELIVWKLAQFEEDRQKLKAKRKIESDNLENGSLASSELEINNWLNLKLSAPLKPSVFVIESIWSGEGEFEITGYDLQSKNEITYSYNDAYFWSDLDNNIATRLKEIKAFPELSKLNEPSNQIFDENGNLNEAIFLYEYSSSKVWSLQDLDPPFRVKLLTRKTENGDEFIYLDDFVSGFFEPIQTPKSSTILEKSSSIRKHADILFTHQLSIGDAEFHLFFVRDRSTKSISIQAYPEISDTKNLLPAFVLYGTQENLLKTWEYMTSD